MNNKEVISRVESKRDLILEVERYIWNHPESGFREENTSRYLAEKFMTLGYEIHSAGDIPGFYAEADTGKEGPCIMFIGEMDSLIIPDHPEADELTGYAHSCGHNAQCATLVGAAAVFAEKDSLEGLIGKIRFLIVPAEEMIEVEYRESLVDLGKLRFTNGKPELMDRGMVDGVDIAIMGHASTIDKKHSIEVYPGHNGCICKTVSYHGKAAHAAGPHKGVNALQAATLGIHAINSLRETFRESDYVRVNTIITKGGEIGNAVPSEVHLETMVRASTRDVMRDVNDRINLAIAASAAAVGGTVDIKDVSAYEPFYNEKELNKLIIESADDIPTIEHKIISDDWGRGSTDMGSLAAIMPVTHYYVGGVSGTSHGNDYQITHPDALCLDGAKVYIMAAVKLLSHNAERASMIIKNYKPSYGNIEDYLDDFESGTRIINAVEYLDNGNVVLNRN